MMKLSSINRDGGIWYFENCFGVKTDIFNANYYLDNKSRVLKHTSDECETIPSFIIKLNRKHEKIFPDDNQKYGDTLDYVLMDFILAKELSGKSSPFRVCEIGCDTGVLSYHLTEMIGRFNGASQLCLATDTIDNDGNNFFLDAISLAEYQPELSMFVGDYDKTNQQSNSFDIVVINGTINFLNPYNVIKEAERILKKDGIIICFSCHNHLLDSTFKLIFSEREEYNVLPDEIITVVRVNDETWYHEAYDFKKELSEFKLRLASIISTTNDISVFRSFYIKADKLIDKAIENYYVNEKIILIKVRGLLADIIVSKNNEVSEKYKQELSDMLSK